MGDQPSTKQQSIQQQQSTHRAVRIPRRNGKFHFSGLQGLHGLNAIKMILDAQTYQKRHAKDSEGWVFGIQNSDSKVIGNVRFSCKGLGCEVQIMRLGYSYEVYYEGDVTATLIPLDRDMMWAAIPRGWNHRDDAICDVRELETCYGNLEPFAPGKRIDGDLFIQGSHEGGTGQGFLMGEDTSARIPSSYGFIGKRYVWAPERHGTRFCCDLIVRQGNENYRAEAIIYTLKDPVTDNNYLSYGRWMVIYLDRNKNTRWLVNAAMPVPRWHRYTDPKQRGPQQGLGSVSGKATYKGGSTGWYAFTGDEADAGHFTARATLNANFSEDSSNLWIKGTIDRFVDEDGQRRNWSVDLQGNDPRGNKFRDRRGNYAEFIGSSSTVWTIDGTPAAPARKWSAKGWDNGNYVQGTFEAAHGTTGRMVGSYLTKKQ